MPAKGRFPSMEQRLLRKFYESAGGLRICLILKGGGEVSPSDALPVANLIFSDRGTLMRLILDPEMGFGEAYMQGRLEVEGDLVAVLEAAYQSLSESGRRRWFSRLISRWTAFTQSNSLLGSRKNIHHHYDLNTDFYRLWLDPELVYTCAYFPTASATLEEAQAAKLDYVCRKLQLRSEEHTSELQSHLNLVCRLLLEKKKKCNRFYTELVIAIRSHRYCRTSSVQLSVHVGQ